MRAKAAIAASVRRLRRPLARELPADAARDRVLRMASGAALVIAAIERFDRPRPKVTVDGDQMALADVLGRRTLHVETMSMARARLAQSHFSALVPDTAMRFKAIQVRSLQAALEEARSLPKAAEPEIPPEAVAQFQRDFYEKHYREWLDIPVPALGHRTPREAAGVKKLRARLVALVEGIEVQAARDAKEGRGFDVSYLRTELGLPFGDY